MARRKAVAQKDSLFIRIAFVAHWSHRAFVMRLAESRPPAKRSRQKGRTREPWKIVRGANGLRQAKMNDHGIAVLAFRASRFSRPGDLHSSAPLHSQKRRPRKRKRMKQGTAKSNSTYLSDKKWPLFLKADWLTEAACTAGWEAAKADRVTEAKEIRGQDRSGGWDELQKQRLQPAAARAGGEQETSEKMDDKYEHVPNST